ncbi:LysE family translocator [Kitasatospora gansuensis]
MVGLLTLTPGLDTALILRTAALGERARAWGVVLGINTGTMIWGAASSLGISALLTASRLAYETLRWAGVAYLLWIGLQMLCGQMLRGSGTPGRTRSRTPAPAASGPAGGGVR